jgi:hypothetical protein
MNPNSGEIINASIIVATPTSQKCSLKRLEKFVCSQSTIEAADVITTIASNFVILRM